MFVKVNFMALQYFKILKIFEFLVEFATKQFSCHDFEFLSSSTKKCFLYDSLTQVIIDASKFGNVKT